MDESTKAASPAANQAGSQPTPQLVNRWQPITDLYQQEITAPPPMPVVEAPKPAAQVKKEKGALDVVPVSIYIIAAVYFLRAVIDLVLAGPLLTNPGSDFSTWMVMHNRILVPFAIAARSPARFATLLGQALVIMAILSAVIGGMWAVRWWRIRFFTMCYAGGMLVRVGIYLFAGVASGVGSGLSSDDVGVLMFSCSINLLIFCYLAFYPGVKLAFEKHY